MNFNNKSYCPQKKRIALSHGFTIVLLTLFFIPTFLACQSSRDIKISASAFGDYYWIAQNHNTALNGMNGFWIRRIYLTFDKEINNSFSARLRFDMSSAGDFKSNSLLTPVVKDAYISWQNEYTSILLGIQPTPSIPTVEKYWKYRCVEKTLEDLQKITTTRETGIMIKGSFTKKENLNYNLMLANGNAEKSEINKGKMIAMSLDYNINQFSLVELYADWNDNPGNTDWITIHGFIGIEFHTGLLGLQYIYQKRNSAEANNYNINAASLFASFNLCEEISTLIRVDRLFNPNPLGGSISYLPFDDSSNSLLIIAGMDYHPYKEISFIPNFEIVSYDSPKNGNYPKVDVIPRLTFNFNL